LDKDDDDDKLADPGAPTVGISRSGDANDNDNGESKQDTLSGDYATRKWKGTNNGKKPGTVTENWKENGKGKGKGNGKGKSIVKHTPGGEDVSRAIALHLQMEMTEADLDTEG
jgi:hypothetical protein